MKDRHRQELGHRRARRWCWPGVGSGGLEPCVRAFGLVAVTLLMCTSPVSGAREPSKGCVSSVTQSLRHLFGDPGAKPGTVSRWLRTKRKTKTPDGRQLAPSKYRRLVGKEGVVLRYDADLTLFSPEGRLYQVEYVMRAVGQYGPPVVGVHGDDCCVVACRRELPDDLVYPESVSSIFRITDDIYGACTGMPGDVRYQVKRARLQALEYKRQYGSPMPSRLLVLAMADAAQVNTQHAAMRPMACVSLFISVDDPAGPLLFRVEPSGQFFPAWGTAAGRGSAPSVEFLERALEEARDKQAVTVEGGVGEEERPATQGMENAEGFDDDGGGEGDVEAGDGGHVGANGQGGNGAEVSPGSGGSQDDGGGAGLEGFIHGDDRRELEERLRRRESGFGVVGEDETVVLALKALSKTSFGKEQERPLTDANVEIAIASTRRGIRVCSRAEVKGFLGKLACAQQ